MAALALGAWVYLLTARGGFWRTAQRDGMLQPAPETTAWPRVAVVIPARDEADVIGTNVRSLLAQDYPGAFSLIVVDDHSADNTVAEVEGAAAMEPPGRLTLLAAPAFPTDGPASCGRSTMAFDTPRRWPNRPSSCC